MLLEMLDWYELPIPNSPTVINLLKSFCLSESMQQTCLNSVGLFGGAENKFLNKVHYIVGFCIISLTLWYVTVIASPNDRTWNFRFCH